MVYSTRYFYLAAAILVAFVSLAIYSCGPNGDKDSRQASDKSQVDHKIVNLTTDDNIRLAATLYLPTKGGEASKHPGVVLSHQAGSDRSEWDSMAKTLAQNGFAALTYDIRGHGQSQKVDNMRGLFGDPNRAPKDLQAALAYLAKHKRVISDRLAVVGSSIGGNLALAASSREDVRTVVALSAKTSAVKALSGDKSLELGSAFVIASAEDQGGKRAQWAKELYKLSRNPNRLKIAEGGEHGVSLFADNPKIPRQILTWLQKYQ